MDRSVKQKDQSVLREGEGERKKIGRERDEKTDSWHCLSKSKTTMFVACLLVKTIGLSPKQTLLFNCLILKLL